MSVGGRLKDIFSFRKSFSDDEKSEASRKRDEIISRAEAMKRLVDNHDFKLFCQICSEDRELLNKNLLDMEVTNPLVKDIDRQRERLIARINQIDRVLHKPKQLIWQMENLTEIRLAIKEKIRKKTHERQALGNKTGGNENG